MKLTHIMAGTALLFSGFAAGSVAVGLSASATSNSITFYACSNKTTGVLSATSTKAPTCVKTSTRVSWNTGISLPSGVFFANGYLIMPRAALWGADLAATNLTHANLGGANLSNADLTGANVTNAYLDGANLTGATCPNGKVHGHAGANC